MRIDTATIKPVHSSALDWTYKVICCIKMDGMV
jgi:hypothetical protein